MGNSADHTPQQAHGQAEVRHASEHGKVGRSLPRARGERLASGRGPDSAVVHETLPGCMGYHKPAVGGSATSAASHCAQVTAAGLQLQDCAKAPLS